MHFPCVLHCLFNVEHRLKKYTAKSKVRKVCVKKKKSLIFGNHQTCNLLGYFQTYTTPKALCQTQEVHVFSLSVFEVYGDSKSM